jgi:hypothetical protein
MTEQIDGLPEVVEYGGFKVEYAGTSTFKTGGQLWYRHEYAYCDMPHITERVSFFRAEGDDEPIPLVTDGFEVVFESPRQELPYMREKRRKLAGYQKKYKAKKQLQDALYQDECRNADMRPPLDLVHVIRNQIKPFGGES